MLNLFKKIKKENSVQVITAIHNEFDIAGETLLREAKEILASDIDTDKGERLSKLGFGSSRAAVDAKTVSDIKTKSKKIAERVEYFRTYYPNYKFITEEMVEVICKKYGLLCGSASIYIGDVPEKNVKEIEKFKLREEDMDRRTNIDDWYDMARRMSMMQFDPRRRSTIGQDFPSNVVEIKTKPEFKICAPVKDFDTSRMRIKDGYSLQDIPDPIVLQPVNGGYLIVSKWGLEGQDESLVNEISN